MLFNSFQFLLFFPIVTILFFVLPHKLRWSLLLAASCYFYMVFKPIYILILIFTIIIDYVAGIYLEKITDKHRKKWFLIMSLIANIGVLAVFKYYNFFNENLTGLAGLMGIKNPIPYMDIILPIGLSFHTFQAMSYTIEVYRGNQKAEKHFGIYSLYVMFYPQLVAGPIERPQNLIHQFHEEHSFDYYRMVEGLKQMLWGIFKKVVIADRLAIYVNAVYNNVENHNGITLLVATVFFAFQIYCDFSGYSDIAIGAAKVMGFKLMTNFKRPYFSQSISEFWSRWHISLSTWFRDYLYISLGGNRVSVPRWLFNLMFVFLVSGFWHGAKWTFVIWGALNGFYLVFAIITEKFRNKLSQVLLIERIPWINKNLQILTTFVLACFAWIFFRANSINDAFLVIKKTMHFDGRLYIDSISTISCCLFGIFFLILVELKFEFYKGNFSFLNHPNVFLRNFSCVLLIIAILLIGVFDGSQFIYFQF